MAASETILIAFDGSDSSRFALHRAAKLFPGSHAVIATVWQPTPIGAMGSGTLGPVDSFDIEGQLQVDAAQEKSAQRISEEGAALARDAGLVPEPHVVEDAPSWHGIITLADEQDASTIVIGSRGHGKLRSALLGSVSNGVVHHSHRPVMVIRDDEHEPPKH